MSITTQFPLLYPPDNTVSTIRETRYNELFTILVNSGIPKELINKGLAYDASGAMSYIYWKELYDLIELVNFLSYYSNEVYVLVNPCPANSEYSVSNEDLLALHEKYSIDCIRTTLFCTYGVVEVVNKLIEYAEQYSKDNLLSDENYEDFYLEAFSDNCIGYLPK